MMAATQAQYDAATKALLDLEQQIVKERNIPTFMLPPLAIQQQYAARAAKVSVDAALAVQT